MPIRTHLIAGFLGAGKTTTLLHLLRGLKARGERCAVLVNEFGALGIDGTVLLDSPAMSVREIPDGCICCTLAGRLLEALDEIAAKVAPQRLFVEPTGLARPEEIRRIFADERVANQFELGPVLTVVAPQTFLKLQGRAMPFYEGQLAEADVLVANKIDCIDAGDLARFRAALPKSNARARVIETTFGQIPLDVLDFPPAQGVTSALASAGHAHTHEHAPGVSVSFRKSKDARFEIARLRAFFKQLEAGALGVRPLRAKGIFKTGAGDILFNLSDSGVDERALGGAEDSRVDLVAETLAPEMRVALEAAFEACVCGAASAEGKRA